MITQYALEVIQDSTFKKLDTIQHGFFTRLGGVSTGIYSSLNCAYPSNDDPYNVRENRRRAMTYFGCSLESLVTVRNVHSNKVTFVEAMARKAKTFVMIISGNLKIKIIALTERCIQIRAVYLFLLC